MKKKMVFLFVFLLITFMNILAVPAEIINPGTSGSTGDLSNAGSGKWGSDKVGIKVSIITSAGDLKDVEIILNKKVSGYYFSNDNRPKIYQSTNVTWAKYNYTNVESGILGERWTTNSGYKDLNEILTEDSYTNLKTILNKYFNDVTFESTDYILVEPMVAVSGYYGTAYELGNAFLTLNSNCKSEGNFCWMYSGALFGGSANYKDGGVLWGTIYYEGNNLTFGGYSLTKYNGSSYTDRHNCLKNSTCSRGIGVYKYSDVNPPETTPSTPTTPPSSNSCTSDLDSLNERYNTCTNCRQCQDIAGLGAPASDVRACFASCQERCKSTYISGLFRLHDKYPKDTNLLNFSGASCGAADCGVKEASCFGGSFSIGATFNQNNLSCYTDKIDVNGAPAYCLTTFNFSNQILGWNTTPGKILFNTINGEVINSTLTQKCYMYNSSPSSFSTGNYYDYIKNVTVVNDYNNETIFFPNSNTSMTVSRKSKNGDFSYYFGSWTNIYKMNAIYADNGSGKLSSLSCPNCKFLGYGLVSELNQRGPSSLSFTFDFNTKYTKEKGINKYSATCPYTINSGLIGSKDEKDYMNLEFRIVNTNSDNLFLSKDGTGSRKPGANWKGQEDILKNNNNSYNKDNSEPLYTITLTPSIMEDIKKYNKDNAYDDYNLECIKDGTVCISNYLTTLRSDYGLKINNSKKRACYEDNHC
ncbi:MAG: hypothetical protein E7174_01460 [Firmicutes bacterium]|nr:hypothetical protein [Bacillota bacterium]